MCSTLNVSFGLVLVFCFLDVLELEISLYSAMLLFQFKLQSRLVKRCKIGFVLYLFLLSFILFCI